MKKTRRGFKFFKFPFRLPHFPRPTTARSINRTHKQAKNAMRRNDERVAAAGTKKTMVIPIASSSSEKRRDTDVVYRADDAAAPTTGNVELSSRWHQQQSTGSRAPLADDDVAAVDTTAASAATVPSIFDFAFSMIPRGEELRTDHTDSADALHSFFYGGLPRSQAEGERMSDRTQVDIKERTVVNLS